jgi:hypothetical protein
MQKYLSELPQKLTVTIIYSAVIHALGEMVIIRNAGKDFKQSLASPEHLLRRQILIAPP